jgi:hypothetical protein
MASLDSSKDLAAELKSIRARNTDLPNTRPLTLSQLEDIARNRNMEEHARNKKPFSTLGRLLSDHYSSINNLEISVGSYHDETLMYIFYSIASTSLQIESYNELIRRGHGYLKHPGLFLVLGNTNLESMRDTARTFSVFDPYIWKMDQKEFVVDELFISNVEHNSTE